MAAAVRRHMRRRLTRDTEQAHGQIWDLGGQREFVSMLPLVSNDAVAILFMFDLTRKTTLNSVKEWYRQARGFNKVCLSSCITWRRCSQCIMGMAIAQHGQSAIGIQIRSTRLIRQTAIPVLIGTKYDTFAALPREEQEEVTKQAKRFSKAMHAPLVSIGNVTMQGKGVWGIDDSDILLDLTFYQCAKDLQDCPRQGIRSKGA